MYSCHSLLCFSNVESAVFFDEVRVADASLVLVGIEDDLRQPPSNHLALRRVLLDAPQQPNRVSASGSFAVIVPSCDIVVEPVDEFAGVPTCFQSADKIGGSRVVDLGPARIVSHESGSGPRPTAIA